MFIIQNLLKKINKNIFAILIVFVALVLLTNKVDAQENNSLKDSISQELGIPSGIEHGKSDTDVVGFNGEDPFVVSRFGSIPSDPSSFFSIEILGDTVMPDMQVMFDAIFGIYNGTDVKCDFLTAKCPIITRWLHQYNLESPLKLEPTADKLGFRENWEPGTPLFDFICNNLIDCEKDNDLALGKKSTLYQPQFVACIQEEGETGLTGIMFTMEGTIANEEKSAFSALSTANNYATKRIVAETGLAEQEVASSQRFANSTDRVEPEFPSAETPVLADCSDCKSWAGDLCETEGLTLPSTDTIAAGLNKIAALIESWGSWLNVFRGLLGREFNIYLYARNLEIPYRNEGSNDLRFARAMSYAPGVPGHDRMDIDNKYADAVNIVNFRLRSPDGSFTVETPIRQAQIIHKSLAADLYAWCNLQKSIHPPCSEGFKSCWDYIGARNNYTTEKSREIEFPDGVTRPPGAIAEWCYGVQNGAGEIEPEIAELSTDEESVEEVEDEEDT